MSTTHIVDLPLDARGAYYRVPWIGDGSRTKRLDGIHGIMGTSKRNDGVRMAEAMDKQAIELMRAVTISREYGSAGGEIGARLARHLDWDLVDHEIVARAARRLGVSEAEARALDEHAPGPLSRLVSSLFDVAPTEVPATPEELPIEPEKIYHDAFKQIVLAAAQAGHVVIVGRGGQVYLRDQRDVLRVRITASLPKRIDYVIRREGLDRATAQARVHLKDKQRANFLQAACGCNVADSTLYDLTFNTDELDLDSVCDLIASALERKARLLARSPSEIGPAAGLPRYREKPADFQPQTWADD